MEELLNTRHHLGRYNQAGMAALAALPEAQRAEHSQLVRLGNSTYRYQQQAQGEVTEEDFHYWLAGLPEKLRVAMEHDGLEASKNSWPAGQDGGVHAAHLKALPGSAPEATLAAGIFHQAHPGIPPPASTIKPMFSWLMYTLPATSTFCVGVLVQRLEAGKNYVTLHLAG